MDPDKRAGSEQIAIREATVDDLEGLAALLDDIMEMHVAALPEYFRSMDSHAEASWMLGEVADTPKSVLLVAEVDGQVVGLVHFDEREAADHPTLAPRLYLKVRTLVVAATHRNRGIGKALMARAHDWAEARGLTEAELNVYEYNHPAIDLYEGLGYETRMRRMIRKLARPAGSRPGSEGSNA